MAVDAQAPARGFYEAKFRTCPETGLKVCAQAEALIKANAVVAVVFLAVGGFFGLLVALTRWPAVHLLPADWFYLLLTAHGADVLLFWIIFFEMAVLYFASAILLNCRLAAPKFAWLGFILMLVGAIVANVAVLQGESSVMFTSYVPMQAAPHFYLGLILFAVGALIGCFVFFGTLVIAKEEGTYQGSIPLVTFGAVTAAIIAVFTIASGAIILIPTFLWSVGYISHIDPLMYKVVWWAMGHSSQQINVSAQVAIWYAIAAMLLGAKPLSEKVSRMAFLMYILFLQLASAHHLLVEPGISSEWKIFNTSYALYLAVLGSMIHGMSIPGAMEAAQRKRGLTNGAFEWLRKAPWGNPAFSGTVFSIGIFGFLGGISGVVMGTEQLNLIMHNTLYVPGHFHATVVGGTTLAFMAITYLLVPLIFRKEIMLKKVAQWQPYVFGIGIAGISLFMMGAGTLGVSRRHWDIGFSDAAMSFDYPAMAFAMMTMNGIAGVLATVGGLMFVIVIVLSVFFGKPRTPEAIAATPTLGAGGEVVAQAGSETHPKLPGTIILVAVFLVAFVLYYYVNWKYLSEIWPLS
ncbi:MAG: cbb3-type cytochrome c oxidase subunit I [Alphaproteobacteria bacterium]|nr:cbb3-type cytochrome c oxidase subunit I [Alphaproteobacteria bacterium]MDP6812808.1 cbb3-type cytochrome c oxidase subunit I [Alphaproteobacteria bacterium]